MMSLEGYLAVAINFAFKGKCCQEVVNALDIEQDGFPLGLKGTARPQ
jgi:hypothetical protein